MEGIPTGVDFLDSGADGFYRTKPYLVFGASGTGKSILGLQFAHAGLTRGEGALVVCREKAEDLIEQAERLGFPLSEYLENGQLVLLEYDAEFRDIVTRQGPESVLEELRAQVEDVEVRRVVFDPVDAFFSSLDDEALLRSQLRGVTGRAEELGWTPLLLCDDTTVSQQPFVMRVFAEVCWGLFELKRPSEGGAEHSLLVYKMRNVNLDRGKFGFRIGEGGLSSGEHSSSADSQRSSFSRFRLADRLGGRTPEQKRRKSDPAPPSPPGTREPSHDIRTPSRSAEDTESLDLLDDEDLQDLERTARARLRSASGHGPITQPVGTRRPIVLVVEESDTVRSEIVGALRQGHDVIEARRGIEGLAAASRERPDLVVASAAMTQLNGIGLCRILRECEADVPVLLISSRHARPGERARCLMAGGDETMARPVDVREVRAKVEDLLRRRPSGSSFWPSIDPDHAGEKLVPRRVQPTELEDHVVAMAKQARDGEVPLCLLGYGFRFVQGEAQHPFVDRFFERLQQEVRIEDTLCRLQDDRIVVLLVDATEEGARAVVGRVHEGMAEEAVRYLGGGSVKPKALYRILGVQPEPMDGEVFDSGLVEQLFRQAPRLIEEDQDDRPGAPVEKYPLLEAVAGALVGNNASCESPLDGRTHAVHQEGDVRVVIIDEYRYSTQDPGEESPAGFRASRGAEIIWVRRNALDEKIVARVEDGRVFRGHDA